MSRWKQQRGLLAVIPALGLLSACGANPTQPTTTEGVTVYQHPNYGGESHMFIRDHNNLDDLRGPCLAADASTAGSSWHSCVSSIQVAEGWEAVLFERDDFAGESLSVTSDITDLEDQGGPSSCGGHWDDCILSIQVFQTN